jgi:hypothetical protein
MLYSLTTKEVTWIGTWAGTGSVKKN